MIMNYGKKYVYKNIKGKGGGKIAVVLTDAHLVKTRKNHICQECEECRDYFVENCKGCNDYNFCLGENYQVGAIRRCRQENGVVR